MVQLPPEILDRMKGYTLIHGYSGDAVNGCQICFLELAAAVDAWRRGTDLKPGYNLIIPRVHPIARPLIVYRNDGPWDNDHQRTAWGLPLVARLLESRPPARRIVQDALTCVDTALRVMWPRIADRSDRPDLARSLRELPPITTVPEAHKALRVAVYHFNIDEVGLKEAFYCIERHENPMFTESELLDAAVAAAQECIYTALTHSREPDPIHENWKIVEILIEQFLSESSTCQS